MPGNNIKSLSSVWADKISICQPENLAVIGLEEIVQEENLLGKSGDRLEPVTLKMQI